MSKAKQVKSLAELETFATNTIGNAIWDSPYIKDVIAEEMSQAVVDVVYSEHTPKSYERRGDDGGLSDVRNVELIDVQKTASGLKLTIENLTEGEDTMQGKFIADMIEEGNVDNWSNPNGVWTKPRPFIEETINRLAENPDKLKEALRKTLLDLGFQVK